MLHIHLVFDELDDGKNKVGVAQPAKNVVEDAEVFVLHTACYAVRERRKHHARHHGETVFHSTRNSEGIVVGIAWHADNQVYTHALHHLFGLFYCAYLLERGWIT